MQRCRSRDPARLLRREPQRRRGADHPVLRRYLQPVSSMLTLIYWWKTSTNVKKREYTSIPVQLPGEGCGPGHVLRRHRGRDATGAEPLRRQTQTSPTPESTPRDPRRCKLVRLSAALLTDAARPFPFLLLDGLIGDLAPWLLSGGHGIVSGIPNFAPAASVRLWTLLRSDGGKDDDSDVTESRRVEAARIQAVLSRADALAVPAGVRGMSRSIPLALFIYYCLYLCLPVYLLGRPTAPLFPVRFASQTRTWTKTGASHRMCSTNCTDTALRRDCPCCP